MYSQYLLVNVRRMNIVDNCHHVFKHFEYKRETHMQEELAQMFWTDLTKTEQGASQWEMILHLSCILPLLADG